MKTRPIRPARLRPDADGHRSHPSGLDDASPLRKDTADPAREVFLAGNGLPSRWAGRDRFVVLDTGFGVGDGFLATWQAWREDPHRSERLTYVGIDPHPPRLEDLTTAHARSRHPDLAALLLEAWPPLTANLHPLQFEGGRVRLLLGWGDAGHMLRQMELRFDALFLETSVLGQEPGTDEAHFIKALARRAAPDATAASQSVAAPLRDALVSAGFEVKTSHGANEQTRFTAARFDPRFHPRGPARSEVAVANATGGARRAVVVGAGLAGAWVAHELAGLGWQVTVLDRHAEPASETSGNPAGLFHGTVHDGDGPYARLFRAAALLAQRRLQPLIDNGEVPGQLKGLLRLERHTDAVARMRSLLDAQGLPDDYLQAFDAAQARERAGVPLAHAAWFYPGGGWIAPPDLVRHLLRTPGVRFEGGADVAQLSQVGPVWQLLDAHQAPLAEAPVVVLAHGDRTMALTAAMGLDPWPLTRIRGQVTLWPADQGAPVPLAVPVAGDGYALPLPDGSLLCGATSSDGDDEAPLRQSDHFANLARLERLTGLSGISAAAATSTGLLGGRVGWRLQAADRLPVVGPVPRPKADWPPGRHDQTRLVPRVPGLYVATAFGARGLTLAPLAAALLAAQINGDPWPLENDLVEAIDPARWQVRTVRRGGQA